MYYKIVNADGKQWVMPSRNMRIGMMLYQPSAWTGKILKALFPWLSWSKVIRKVLHIEVCDRPLDEVTFAYLNHQFRDNDLEYAFFMGTPSKNQKITVQISKGEKILGYCKLTQSERINELFLCEQNTLEFLAMKGTSGIPSCLDCRRLNNGYYAFLQSTEKTLQSTIEHVITEQHVSFVEKLKEQTSVEISYQESDFGKMITKLRDHLYVYESHDKEVLSKAISIIDDFYKDKTCYCAFHGDFTPWNTFIEKGQLFAFDFEYAKRSCPAYMDLMHFVGQVGLLEKKLIGEDLYNYVYACVLRICPNVENLKVLYLSYLLYIFTFYSEIFEWRFPKNDIGYRGWVSQISIILNNSSDLS